MEKETGTHSNYTIIVHTCVWWKSTYNLCIALWLLWWWDECIVEHEPAKGDERKTKSHYLAITSLSCDHHVHDETIITIPESQTKHEQELPLPGEHSCVNIVHQFGRTYAYN